MIIAANMWDDVEDKSLSIRQINDEEIKHLLPSRGIPVVPVSGLYGKGLERLFEAVQTIHSIWQGEFLLQS